MYIGEIVNIDNSYFVYVPSVPYKQKVYPISSISAMNILDNQDSRIVEVELIPKHEELDEQPEYTAHIINPLNPTKNEKDSQ
jgi:hypothetical protein